MKGRVARVVDVTKCGQCGTSFDIDDARDEYNSEFNGDLNYDEDTDGDLCGNCAIAEIESKMNLGRAIDMMNGDEDYDDDFVQQHL